MLFATKKKIKKTGNQQVGEEGEALARRFLEKKGFIVVHHNFRCRGGEVDLIAESKGELHFIEVKTRQSLQFGAPFESVSYHKKKRLALAAQYYLLTHNEWENRPKVFSVISVDSVTQPVKIEFFPNAFEINGEYY